MHIQIKRRREVNNKKKKIKIVNIIYILYILLQQNQKKFKFLQIKYR